MNIKQIVEILMENGINVTIEKIIDQLDNVGALDEIGYENADENFEVEDEYVKKFSKLYKIDLKPKKANKPSEASKEINKRSTICPFHDF